MKEFKAILDVHNILLCMCDMIKGYVCSMSVQSVKHIYSIYIFNITLNNVDYTMFWGTYTNCKSSAVPQ